MSGIALTALRAPASPRRDVEQMLARMRHRGPDGRGLLERHSDGWNICIGHAAHWGTPEDVDTRQPLVSESGCVISFDGRLDNRSELLRHRQLPIDSPDARLVLDAYERWGEASPSHLLGDFAFVIWDAARGRIFAARDRLGLINLYYHTDASRLHVSSEQQALFSDSLQAKPNLQTLASALVEEYCERGATLYRDVLSLEPGHVLSWSEGKLSTRPYWQLDLQRQNPRGEDHPAHYRETLREAVRARMRTRGPVAITVSGGLDSSAVAALAISIARAGEAHMPVLVTTRYPGLPCDESTFSARLADHLGVPLRAVDAPVSGYGLPDQRELFYDPSFRLWRLMAEASEGARVMMSGIGSDELIWPTGFEVDDAWVDGDVRLAMKLAGVVDDPLSVSPWRRLAGGLKRLGRRAIRKTPAATNSFLPSWLTPEGAELIVEARRERLVQTAHLRDRHPSRVLIATGLTFGSQAPFGISQSVQCGPHLGVETRHPFFDSRVVEAAFATPLEARCSFGITKALLRNAIDPLLPPSLVWRTQGAEFTSFFRRALFSSEAQIAELFRSSRLEMLGLVRKGAMARLLSEARDDVSRSRELVATLTFEGWLRTIE